MDLQQANILISSIEDKGNMLKIKSQEGKTYTVFKTKQDGTQTKAIETMNGHGVGSSVAISFKEEQKEYQGKSYTARTILSFGGTVPQTVTSTAGTVSFSNLKEEEARGKVRHGVAVEAFKMAMELNNDTADTINKWVDYIMTGELKSVQEIKTNNETISYDNSEDIDTEDIPF